LRQIGEALKISTSKDNILNSTGEYLSNCISGEEKEVGKRRRIWKRLKLKYS
jgi:hypothetical protein